jgi:hypothetical protein
MVLALGCSPPSGPAEAGLLSRLQPPRTQIAAAIMHAALKTFFPLVMPQSPSVKFKNGLKTFLK